MPLTTFVPAHDVVAGDVITFGRGDEHTVLRTGRGSKQRTLWLRSNATGAEWTTTETPSSVLEVVVPDCGCDERSTCVQHVGWDHS